MATSDFNLSLLYKEAFGYVARDYPKADVHPLNKAENLVNPPMLGIYVPMVIVLDFVPLPNAPLISVSASKNIVTTQIAGRKGTVKELINQNDYRITIKGVLTSVVGIATADAIDLYPIAEVKILQNICEKQESIGVVNLLLNTLGITQIVIESYEFPDMEGFPGVQPYTISAISDDDPELVLIDEIF